jgi:hypothetical protein
VGNASGVFQAGTARVFSIAHGRELSGGSVVQTAVRLFFVVLSAPDCSLPSGIEQVLKPTYSQTFLAQPSMEALHVSILCRLTRLDMHWFDPPFQTPGQEMPAGEFWPIVERIDCGHR